MSYPPEHKSQTHARIVGVASKTFREEGMLATGIDTLMADAGLTRGGFYAHFASKAALFAESLTFAFADARDNLLGRGLDRKVGRDWILGATKRYLARSHRDTAAEGCAIPTLGAEVARAPEEVRDAFGRELDALIDGFATRAQAGKEDMTALLATWVGAVLMARAVKDPAQSNAILEACRAQIAQRFADAAAPTADADAARAT